tara:strand:+ start:129 stop:1505 length:1377 start_codon:yes stop_codon:yes gene_type:complete
MSNIFLNDLQKLYIAFFSRPGDPSGINYWLSHPNKSLTVRDIANELSRQDEYTKYISQDKSFEFQINKIYLNIYARKADFEGLNYWLEMVESKSYQISDIVYDLIYKYDEIVTNDSEQFKKDIDIFKNKIDVAKRFTSEISKNITLMNLYQPESLNPWISGNKLKKASNFLSNVKHKNISSNEINDLINSFLTSSTKKLNQPAIEMKDISLSIPVHYLENRSLTKRFAKRFINITGGELSQSGNGTNILALNHINLMIMNGERIGLIGHNGSGKSSFLRLISGIYIPTNGELKISIDVYPMLQKTFLTSSELTGIDACKAHFLLRNHTLFGFESFLDEIIEFSGLGQYISLPIKTYSEGMSARLIFSILTSSPHDCLAIDEGFGTGDADFFDKAEERMQKFMGSATTLILASHSEELLKQFCNRGIVFSHGSIVYDGPLEAALNYYHTHDYHQQNVIR